MVLGLATLFLLVGLLVWHAITIVLLAFVAVLLAVLLATPAHALHERTRIPYWLSLLLVVLSLVGLLAAASWFVGDQVMQQAAEFREEVPQLIDQLEDTLLDLPGGPWLIEQLDRAEAGEMTGAGTDVVARVTGTASAVFEGMVRLAFVLFLALFLAAAPGRYRDGLVLAIPRRHRGRAREVLGHLATTLQWWLLGQLASMLIVGALVTVGLLLLGVPYALLLGLLAGIAEFIPIVGPLLAFVPAAFVGITQGFDTLLWVAALYLLINQIEGNVIQPLVQRKAVDLPPALTVTVVLLGSATFGLLGMLIATPLTAVVMVLIKTLYLHDVQNEAVELPGGVEES